MNRKRRAVLSQLTAITLFPLYGLTNPMATPHQSSGPFYPTKIPLDSDSDLTYVAGRDGKATGEIVNLYGCISNTIGEALSGLQVEIWQCDAFSAYHHPRAGGGIDPYFQGYGKTVTDSNGGYRFKTIKPVAYPGRAPHIHFRISTGSKELVTQIYVHGNPANDTDFLLQAIPSEKARQLLIIPFAHELNETAGELIAVFNPVVG